MRGKTRYIHMRIGTFYLYVEITRQVISFFNIIHFLGYMRFVVTMRSPLCTLFILCSVKIKAFTDKCYVCNKQKKTGKKNSFVYLEY